MVKQKKNSGKLVIGGKRVLPGKTCDISLAVSETYTGNPVSVFVRVIRARKPGPVVFLTGAVHGDELNGVGIIRNIMMRQLKLLKGTLICVPVANIFGFESHSRYLPDRRDLNRSFPGSQTGSLANRLAYVIFNEIVKKCDYGLDLHTAAIRRTNFPQIRADLNVKNIRKLAEAFGCELIIDKEAHPDSLRATACKAGCPTILYEAGEVLKFEPGTVNLGARGVLNVLSRLGMTNAEIEEPIYQMVTKKTVWVRSDTGGLLHFHVKPGDIVKKGKALATAEKLFSEEAQAIKAPFDGLVIGMTTLPAVKPGEPVCHLAVPSIPLEEIQKKMDGEKTLHRRVQAQLGTSFQLTKAGRKR